MNEFFKYRNLELYLAYIRDNYHVMKFSAWKGENGILLRHDIDFSVESAFRLALIETACGVRSTFFVMMSTYMYNPLAEENRNMLRKMVHFDFEIGLHFDPTIYNDLESAVEAEVSALEFISGKKVASISLHDSGNCEKYPQFSGYINAHNSFIFSDDVYISDSLRDFRGKDPYKFVKKANAAVIQVAFHPYYYI